MHIPKRITLGTVSLLSFSLALVIMGALTQQVDREGSSAQLQGASSSIAAKKRGTNYRPTVPAQTYAMTPGVPSVCGNGNLEPGEECDDRFNNGFGRCSKTCKLQYCGDGVLTPSLGEECEAQLRTYLDPDTNQQYEELGFEIRSCGDILCTAPYSAHGIAGCTRQFLPACPPSTQQARSSEGAPLSIASSSSTPTTTPVNPIPATGSTCGNGVREAGEQCDTGLKNSDSSPNSCRADCSLPRCGDGVVDTYLREQCDGTDNCTASCTLLSPAMSTSSVSANSSAALEVPVAIAQCGNGILEAGEQCDGGAACTTDCQLLYAAASSREDSSSSFSSDTSSSIAPPVPPVCGNGRVEPPEQCDDGNNVTGDACSALCLLENTAIAPAQASAVDGSLFVVFTVMSLLGFITGASVGLLARKGTN